jgi:hypothetical protein
MKWGFDSRCPLISHFPREPLIQSFLEFFLNFFETSPCRSRIKR